MGHTGNNGNGKCGILPLFILSRNLLVFCWADQHFRKTVVLSSNRKHKCKTRVCVYLEAAKGPLFGETSGKLNFFSCKTRHRRILPGNEFHLDGAEKILQSSHYHNLELVYGLPPSLSRALSTLTRTSESSARSPLDLSPTAKTGFGSEGSKEMWEI